MDLDSGNATGKVKYTSVLVEKDQLYVIQTKMEGWEGEEGEISKVKCGRGDISPLNNKHLIWIVALKDLNPNCGLNQNATVISPYLQCNSCNWDNAQYYIYTSVEM